MSTEAYLSQLPKKPLEEKIPLGTEFATPTSSSSSTSSSTSSGSTAALESAQLSMHDLLRERYKKRAKLESFFFKDKQTLHDVSFTIAHYDLEREKARLGAKREKEEKKEGKSGDLEKEQDIEGGELGPTAALEKIIAVKEIFTPTAQLQAKGFSPEEKADSKLVHRVLILGPPGSGKTTLSKHLMTEWLEKRALIQYDSAFWITARDLNNKEKYALFKKCADSQYPLAALIHQLCLDEVAQKTIGIKALDQLLRDSKTLILLDGFDEVAHCLSDNTEQGKPLKNLLNTILQTKTDLLVTSREYSVPPDNIPFDRRLINRGFTDVQIDSYVDRYFANLPKQEEKSEEKSNQSNVSNFKQNLRKNLQLWSHVHNPLILTLACDYYRLQKESGKAQKNLNLLDLYDETLKVFLRRYLDLHTQAKKELHLSWKETQNFSLKSLFGKCPGEMDFLQTLSFKGIEEGRQLFDKTLKETAFEEVLTRYPKLSEVPIRNALKLGLLHEFSGKEASDLHKTHEFLHLTFQEYLGAHYIAERLQRHDKKMYQWLRENKYNPSYRMVLNFLCAQMPANTYPEFWKILLREKTDITCNGHLQLMMQSLEAMDWDSGTSGVQQHLSTIEQSLIQYIKTKKFEEIAWIQDTLRQCPQLVGHLSDSFWSTIDSLLQAKVNGYYKHERSSRFLAVIAIHASQFSKQRQLWLISTLLQDRNNGRVSYFWEEAIDQALKSYAAQVGQFSSKERSQVFEILFKAAGNEEWQNVQRAAIPALKIYVAQVGQFLLQERAQLLETLLKAAKDKELGVRKAAALALVSYAAQSGKFSSQERSQLLETLLKATGDKELWKIRDAIVLALKSYATQTRQFSSQERISLFETLRKTASDKAVLWEVQESAIEALGASAIQAEQFSPQERTQLFETLHRIVSDQEVREEVRKAALNALGVCAIQAEQFSLQERIQLFEALCKAAGDKGQGMQVIAVQILGNCAAHVQQFSLQERSQLLEGLLKAASHKELWRGRDTLVSILKSYVAQAGQFSPQERTQLLETLRKAAADRESSGVRNATIYALSSDSAIQIGQFSAQERRQLLETLCKAAVDGESGARQAAIRALGSYATQVEQFSPQEHTQLFETLRKASSDKESDVRKAAIEALASYAAESGQFPLQGRDQLLEILLKSSSDKDKEVRGTVIKALSVYATHTKQFSQQERIQLFETLFKAVSDQEEWVVEDAIEALGSCATQFSAQERTQAFETLRKALVAKKFLLSLSAYNALEAFQFSREDWLQMAYSKNYSILNQMLADEYFIPSLPVSELLHAYFVDEASLALGSYARRELWLRFLVARIHKEGISILVCKDHCKLYSPKASKPLIVFIPSKKGGELIQKLKKALSFTENTALLEYSDTPVELSKEIPVTISNESGFLEDIFRFVEKQEQDKAGIKAEFKAEIREIHSHLGAHEQRIQSVEKNITQLQTQVQEHQDVLKRHQASIATLKKEVTKVQENIDFTSASLRREMENQCLVLDTHQNALKKIREEIAGMQSSSSIQAENLKKLQEKQSTLQKQCEETENHILKEYAQLCEKVKTGIENLEKSESKQDLFIQELQQKYQATMSTLEKMHTEIEALQQQDIHTLDALQTLQKSEARQKAMLEAYETAQKQLQARENLLSHPKYAEFYRTMYLKLSGFFMVCTVASTGLVKVESQASLSDKITQKIIGVLGENIPVPGAKAAADFINSMLVWHREHEAEAGRGRVGAASPISSIEKEAAIDLAIQEIIYRYGDQIKALTDEGVKDLAECAVNRIAHGIQQEKPLGDPTNFPRYLVNLLHQVKLKQGRLGHKDLETEPGAVVKGKKPWNEDGIFRRTGIQSNVQYYYSDKMESSLLSSEKPMCRYKKYGFRKIQDDKQASVIAKGQEFEKNSTVLPAESFQFSSISPPLQSAPKGSSSMFDKTKQAATAVAKDTLQDAATNFAEGISADPKAAKEIVKNLAGAAGDKVASGLSSLSSGW